MLGFACPFQAEMTFTGTPAFDEHRYVRVPECVQGQCIRLTVNGVKTHWSLKGVVLRLTKDLAVIVLNFQLRLTEKCNMTMAPITTQWLQSCWKTRA